MNLIFKCLLLRILQNLFSLKDIYLKQEMATWLPLFFFFFPLLLILLQFPSPVFAVVLSAISSNLLSGIKNKAMMALHSCI